MAKKVLTRCSLASLTARQDRCNYLHFFCAMRPGKLQDLLLHYIYCYLKSQKDWTSSQEGALEKNNKKRLAIKYLLICCELIGIPQNSALYIRSTGFCTITDRKIEATLLGKLSSKKRQNQPACACNWQGMHGAQWCAGAATLPDLSLTVLKPV